MNSSPVPLTQCQTISSLDALTLNPKLYLMEPKIDGWRIQFEIDGDYIQAWTRTQHDASRKMPKVEWDLRHLCKGKSMRLDGEAVYIDENGMPDYNFTARCLGSQTETCVWKQSTENRWLSYVVFDILRIDDSDLRGRPLEARKDVLFQVLSTTGSVDVVFGDPPTWDQHVRNFERFKEGSVLKLLNSPYAGKRHKSWLKYKNVETIDGKIIGYKEGAGKFMGLIGSIMFECADSSVGYCSGMDDETRIWISDHREELLGRVIEVQHFGRLVDGYRHPQFKGFRKDLEP